MVIIEPEVEISLVSLVKNIEKVFLNKDCHVDSLFLSLFIEPVGVILLALFISGGDMRINYQKIKEFFEFLKSKKDIDDSYRVIQCSRKFNLPRVAILWALNQK